MYKIKLHKQEAACDLDKNRNRRRTGSRNRVEVKIKNVFSITIEV